ncbi:tripartite tricarboxylate transporter substrate binding protein [Polaromonas sp.]|uniref:Bug family tripartite tricarboxylate transporter substrate binding protein n=1 Tax=Polaromonas sp. TaxID=1869339 RepID=UPI0017F47CFC|nr:tripartite tricarboxylate transporter substrate binding protein [Polaromonas sp.]NML86420.1 tripartite tricarboxylate transporter substrate binding protein [Polaromonas sp.]
MNPADTRRRALQRGLRVGSALAAVAAFPGLTRAQAGWPVKPIRLIVPFAPGGSSEIVARSAANELGKTLGQTVFVDNRPGASGNIAMQECASSTDGHTLILGHIGTMAVNPFIFDKLPFDTNRDFRPVSLLAKVPSLYVVNSNVPARNLKEFIALAKSKPGQLNYGSAGNGSAGHLAFEYLKMVSGIFVLHVPYRGTGPQLTDLLAGRLDAASVGAPAILAHIKSGKLRCIATGTRERLPQLPEVPTVAESGYPGFEMTQWYGLNAPSSMPAAAIDKIADACGKAMHNAQATERLRGDTAQPVGDTPAQYGAFIRAEQARWKEVVARAKIKAD